MQSWGGLSHGPRLEPCQLHRQEKHQNVRSRQFLFQKFPGTTVSRQTAGRCVKAPRFSVGFPWGVYQQFCGVELAGFQAPRGSRKKKASVGNRYSAGKGRCPSPVLCFLRNNPDLGFLVMLEGCPFLGGHPENCDFPVGFPLKPQKREMLEVQLASRFYLLRAGPL